MRGSTYSKLKVEPTELGIKQFYEYQTEGKYKLESFGDSTLDNYFFVLRHGKRMFDLISREYQQMYRKGEWWGFYQLWMDWKGNRWLLPHICKWHDNLPEWLGKEEIDEPKESILVTIGQEMD